MTFLKGNGGPRKETCSPLRLVMEFRSKGIMGQVPELVNASSFVTFFLILWASWGFGSR